MSARPPLRFAMFGCGFWARYQLAGWREVPGAECVALYNRTRARAEALGTEFGISAVYDDAQELLNRERLDFVDIVTDVNTHARFVGLAARHGLPAICQKPLAGSLAEAEAMTAACANAGVPLFVHENWRWQRPIRAAHDRLRAGCIGRPFRARIDMISGFPVFDNQPFLKDLEQFILADLGTHILDVARFLFGEAESLYCLTRRVHAEIRGEDAASVQLRMSSGVDVACQLAYAGTPLERECFPQTLMFVEGDQGSLEIAPDYQIRITTAQGTTVERHPPTPYDWVEPAYAVVQSSIVDCHRHLLQGISGGGIPVETTADDNLRTLRLVFDAYESAATGRAIRYVGAEA